MIIAIKRNTVIVDDFPSTIANVWAWYDMSQETAYANNDTVTTMHDFSGNGNDLPRVASEGGLYKTNQLNSLPVLEWSGSNNERYQFGSANSSVPTAFWVGVVFKPAFTNTIVLWADDSQLICNNGVNGTLAVIDTGNDTVFFTGSALGNTWHRLLWRYAAWPNTKGYVDNVSLSIASGSGVGDAPSTQTFKIGNAWLQGQLAEMVVIMDGTLSDSDRNTLDAYWTNKYAL